MTNEEAKEIMCKVTFYWELGEQTLTQIQINEALDLAIKALEQQSESEIKPIGYRECSNAMLKMWMDNVLTDGEHYRIMDKLNAKWSRIAESEGEE